MTRKFKSAPIGCKSVFIVLMVQRVLCLACGALRQVKVRFARPKFRKLKRIAIDEISIGKGHRYLTIVLDLGTGAVVFVGDGISCRLKSIG